jgi:hypothetical protein
VGNELAHQHLALQRQATLQVRVGLGGAGQPVQVNRRLVVATVAPAVQIVEDAARFQHRRRLAEGEGLQLSSRCRRQCLSTVVHQ